MTPEVKYKSRMAFRELIEKIVQREIRKKPVKIKPSQAEKSVQEQGDA